MGAYKALLPEQIEWAFAQWCNGTTQQQLADILFVDVRTIQRMFKGRQKIKKEAPASFVNFPIPEGGTK